MKQLIVMIATIVLGLAIFGYIVGFQTDANTLLTKAKSKITTVTSSGGAL